MSLKMRCTKLVDSSSSSVVDARQGMSHVTTAANGEETILVSNQYHERCRCDIDMSIMQVLIAGPSIAGMSR